MSHHRVQSTNFWCAHIEQWQQSQLSQSAYCREHQLSISRFSYYKYKLEKASPTTTALSHVNTKKTEFVSVKVTDVVTESPPLTLHFAKGAHLSGITNDNVHIAKQLAEVLL